MAQQAGAWEGKPVRAFLVRVAVTVLPIVFAIVVAWQLTRMLPTPSTWPGVIFWWLLVMATSTMALRFADRFAKKLMPLAVLMKLSLVFPDKAPSRFGLSFQTGNAHSLEELIQRAEKAGKSDDLTHAAETILALGAALNAHDPRTRGHGDRVRAYADMLGEEMGYTEEERNKLKWAAMLHDIGKLRVPSEIINAPGKLNDEQWKIIREHPEWGMELAGPLLPWLGEFATAIGQHHERFDGNGYPNGLAGEEIGLAARITSVADTYDVMTSVRSYKEARPASEAREELARCAGSQFDPIVVRAFLNISLGRQRWVAGPLSWLAQVPFFQSALQGATTLAQNAAVAAQTGLTATAIGATAVVAPTLIDLPDPTPPPVAAGLPATTLEVNDDTMTLSEDATETVFVLGNDDAEVMSISVVSGPSHGTAVMTPDGTLSYTPDPDFTGTDAITYRVCDVSGTCRTAVLWITVTAVNDPPGLLEFSPSVEEDASTVIDVISRVTDVDGDPAAAEVTLVGIAAEGLILANGDGTFTYTPPPDFHGTDSFTVQVCDAGGACELRTLAVTVTPVNDPPVVDVVVPAMTEDNPASIFVDASDPDGDTLSTTIVEGPGSGTAVVDIDGSIFYSPAPDFSGAESITIEVCDGVACTTEVIAFAVAPVNDPPIVPGPGPLVTPEDTMISFDPLTGAFDPEGGALGLAGFDAVSANGGSIVEGSLEYTPAADFVGVDTFGYVVGDPGGATTAVTVTITVTGVNDAPTAAPDGYSMLEDAVLTVVAPGVLANDGDVDGDPLAAVPDSAPGNGAVTLNTDGSFMYSPAPNFAGSDSFTYRVEDGAGGFAIGSVAIAVGPVNDAPDAVDDAAATSGPGAISIAVLANDIDVEGDFDVASVSVVVPPTKGSALAKPDGTIDYTPTSGETGSDGFVYEICDLAGTCDTATVTVGLMGPDAVDDTASMTEDSGPVTVDAVANDSDPNGDLDPASAVVHTPASDGLATANGDGTFDYDPDPDFAGIDSFEYKVCDLTAACNTATVTITVTGENDAPVAIDDGIGVAEDNAAGVTFNVLTNDTDVDLDPLTLDSYDGSGVVEGNLTDNGGGSFTYVPDPDFFGVETFTYDVTDGALTDTGLVTITVTNVPDAPDTQDDAYATDRDAPIIEPAPGVLGNDTDYDGDALTAALATPPANGGVVLNPDGSFTYTPDPGYVGGDSFTYTADDGVHPPVAATVDITVDDGIVATGWYLGDSGPSPETYLFVGAPPPLGNPDPDGDGNPGLTILVSDGDEFEADPVRFQQWLLPAGGSPLELNGPVSLKLWSTVEFFELGEPVDLTVWVADCDVTGTVCSPALLNYDVHYNDWNLGVADFTYREVTVGNLDHTVAAGRTLRFRLQFDHTPVWVGMNSDHPTEVVFTEANRPPATGPDSATILEDSGVVNIDVLANDSDPNLDPGSLAVDSAPASGSAVVAAGPTIDYDPDPDFFGTDTFTYQVCDTSASCSTETVTVTVTPVNDAPSFVVGADQAVLEDSGGQTVDPHPTAISAGPANEFGQSVGFTVTNDNPGLFKTAPTIDSGGRLQYEAWDDMSGSAVVTVSLSDDGGTADGGVDTSADQTFTITITGVNDQPGFDDGPDLTVDEDTGPHTFVGWATSITAGAPEEEPPGQVLTFNILANDNTGLFAAGPTIDPSSGDLTFTLAPDANGQANVQANLTDDGGTANGGVDTSVTRTFKITVDPVNDAPVAGDDPVVPGDPLFMAVEDATDPLIITAPVLTSNDSDVDLDPVTIDAASGSSVEGGSYSCTAAGCDYIPPPAFTGDDTFPYTINDGALSSAPATVTIKVRNRSADMELTRIAGPIPDPVGAGNAVSLVYRVDNNGPDHTGGAEFVSPLPANFDYTSATSTKGSCAYDGVLHQVSCGIGSMSPGDVENVTLTVTPHADGSIDLTAWVTASSGDPNVLNNQITVAVTVVNNPPTGVADAPSVLEDSVDALIAVLGNDTDLEGNIDPTATSVVGGVSSGTLVNNGDGTFDYTPTPDYAGTDGFTYQVCDTVGACDSPISVSITVMPVNDPPSFTKGPDQTVMADSGAHSIVGWATAISPGPPDESGQSVSFNTIGNTNPGLFSAQPLVASTGTLVYTVADGQSGSATITIEAQDNGGTANGGVDTSPSQTFQITVEVPDIVISEFRPRGPAGGDDEFVEIFNAGSSPEDLTGWRLHVTSGVDVDFYTFPSVTLLPGQHYLVMSPFSPLTFLADDTWSGVLYGTGFGDVQILTDGGAQVDAFHYGVGPTLGEGMPLPGWTGPNAVDASWERLTGDTFGNCVDTGDNRADFVHNYGKSSLQNMSSPLTPCSTPAVADSVVISELRPSGPSGAEDEFIEVFNPTAGIVDISGWTLEQPSLGLLHTFQGGSILNPGDRYVVGAPSTYAGFKDDSYNGVVPSPWMGNNDSVELKAGPIVVDAVAWGGVPALEGFQLPSYVGIGGDDISFTRGHGGCADLDDNLWDFILSYLASPGTGVC